VKVGGQAAFLVSVQGQQVNVRLPYNLPTEGEVEVVVSRAGAGSARQSVRFAPYAAQIQVADAAVMGMPVWVQVEAPNPPVRMLQYPIRIRPWDWGGHHLEVRFEGRVQEPSYPKAAGVANVYVGLSTFGSVGRGSFLGLPGEPRQKKRLPLHLLYRFERAGRYEVRYVGYDYRYELGERHVLVRSEWVPLEVKWRPEGERLEWVQVRLAAAPEDPVEWLSDYLPSLLAMPDAAVLPAMGKALVHGSGLVRSYAVAALAMFEKDVVDKWLPEQVRAGGPSQELAPFFSGRFGDAEVIGWVLPHLRSRVPRAMAGALQTLYLMQVRLSRSKQALPEEVRQAVAGAAEGLIATHDGDVLRALAIVLGTWKSETSRVLLERLVEEGTAREQAQIALRWIREGK
jgi:hypothetical protein